MYHTCFLFLFSLSLQMRFSDLERDDVCLQCGGMFVWWLGSSMHAFRCCLHFVVLPGTLIVPQRWALPCDNS